MFRSLGRQLQKKQHLGLYKQQASFDAQEVLEKLLQEKITANTKLQWKAIYFPERQEVLIETTHRVLAQEIQLRLPDLYRTLQNSGIVVQRIIVR